MREEKEHLRMEKERIEREKNRLAEDKQGKQTRMNEDVRNAL